MAILVSTNNIKTLGASSQNGYRFFGVDELVSVALAVTETPSSSGIGLAFLFFGPDRPAKLATWSRKQSALNPSISTLHWSAVTAVISTVRCLKMSANDLCALAASHFCRRMAVPVYMGLLGSGDHACLTSRQVERSNLGGFRLVIGSPSAGFQVRLRPSGCIWSTRRRDLHQRDRPCLTTVIPDLKRATKQRTIKSLALVHPVAGLKVGNDMGIRTSCVCVAVEMDCPEFKNSLEILASSSCATPDSSSGLSESG